MIDVTVLKSDTSLFLVHADKFARVEVARILREALWCRGVAGPYSRAESLSTKNKNSCYVGAGLCT